MAVVFGERCCQHVKLYIFRLIFMIWLLPLEKFLDHVNHLQPIAKKKKRNPWRIPFLPFKHIMMIQPRSLKLLCTHYLYQTQQIQKHSQHTFENIVLAKNTMSLKVDRLEKKTIWSSTGRIRLRNKVKELEGVNLEQGFTTSDSLFDNIATMGKGNE